MAKVMGGLLLLAVFISVYAKGQGVIMFNKLNQQREAIGNSAFTAEDFKPGRLRHIVLFKYKKRGAIKERNGRESIPGIKTVDSF
ncbi:hypothetical protein [Serratia marcescens]|uniref:hypothetical protein n=1 Tax=Serratia marcescens TaxID=615 RepID=UPI00217A9AA9|nr:hypothetical protein [Serratia marcescens]CAI1070698.1 Uncharacterised protein [Serratia marcescens]